MSNVTVLNKCTLNGCTYQKSKELEGSVLCTPCVLNTLRRFLILTYPVPVTNELILKVITENDTSNALSQQILRHWAYLKFNMESMVEADNNKTEHKPEDYI